MRLTCPACGAQYEVPANVIPADGREVQCSNCGEVWLQRAEEDPETSESFEAPEEQSENKQTQEDVSPASDPAPASDPQMQDAADPEAAPDAADPAEEEAEVDPTPWVPGRRSIDQNIADLLREEAELEARARRNEMVGGLESQPELGLTEGPLAPEERRRDESRARMAVLRGENASDQPGHGEGSDHDMPVEGSRRDRLPDIEEINSTLRSNEDRPAQDPGQTAQAEVREKRQTRHGFTMIVVLAAILALVYAFAPQIAISLPQADPWLSSYVAQVDNGRTWLNGHVQNMLTWLDAAAASSSE